MRHHVKTAKTAATTKGFHLTAWLHERMEHLEHALHVAEFAHHLLMEWLPLHLAHVHFMFA